MLPIDSISVDDRPRPRQRAAHPRAARRLRARRLRLHASVRRRGPRGVLHRALPARWRRASAPARPRRTGSSSSSQRRDRTPWRTSRASSRRTARSTQMRSTNRPHRVQRAQNRLPPPGPVRAGRPVVVANWRRNPSPRGACSTTAGRGVQLELPVPPELGPERAEHLARPEHLHGAYGAIRAPRRRRPGPASGPCPHAAR